ncbi:lanthionine synthetase C family protein [Paenibacillus sp. SYP-B3998]|uniref:Lanthionine synthetase C family protein n=1 Tax=Paenibacillus sp. SYP-B3998 TaxID=2678564 RepID=A0A6G4A4C9_9BACL|nr:lanthionine synthetase C family protein [Paenibacillus sp. SYP-B3998]NEW08669.1 lanthionine synthetase C family protein [Paenibacillus sp. SYP-B3998]
MKLTEQSLEFVEIHEFRPQIEKILQELGSRLKDAEKVERIATSEGNHILANNGKYYPWQAASLSSGYPGICVYYSLMDHYFPDEDWASVGHDFLSRSINVIKSNGDLNISLWSGLAGIGFAAYSLSKNGTCYQGLLKQINDLILNKAEKLLDVTLNNVQNGSVYVHDYDVISGWAGIGRYLLLFKDIPKVKETLLYIIDYFISLSQHRISGENKVPNWYVPSQNLSLDEKLRFKDGYFNLGLAHGIPGPLAFLSQACIDGFEVKGLKEAIQHFAEWILEWELKDESGGIYLPLILELGEVVSQKVENKAHKEAWCYGTPGLMRAIWLAGKALKNEEWKAKAIESYKSTLLRPQERWDIYSPTFCHGYAGLLHLTSSIYQDSNDDFFKKPILNLTRDIVKMYDENSPFLFHDIHKNSKGNDILNMPGLLDGSVGIGLVLATLIKPNLIPWDICLLTN